MGEFVLGLVVVLAIVTRQLSQRRDDSAGVHWARSWFFLFGCGPALLLSESADWSVAAFRLLAPFFVALALSGALAHAGRSIPVWLLPLAFLSGVTRVSLDAAGYGLLGHGIALAFGAGVLLAAAAHAFRAGRTFSRCRSDHLLAPAFVALAAVASTDAIRGLRGVDVHVLELVAWALVVPFTILVQIRVTRAVVREQEVLASQALSESEQHFRALTENAFDGIAEIDRKGRFTYVNPRCEEWFGLSSVELIGTEAVDRVHAEDRAQTRDWFREQVESADESLLTVRSFHHSGSSRWAEISGQTFASGGEVRVVANFRDVTERIELSRRLQLAHDRLEERVAERTTQLEAEVAERRRVEVELRISEERWRNVSALSSDLSFSLTRHRDGSFTTNWVTEAIERITGRTTREIDAQGWESVGHPDDLVQTMAHLSEIQDGETRDFEGRFVTASGDERWMRMRVSGVEPLADGALQILGAGSDVTDARRAEEEREKMEVEMREAQKLESLGIMAGGVAHDFNNLLAVILGNESLAASEALPGSRLARQLERIRSAAKHAEALANQMLAYSGKAPISPKPFDLHSLVEEMSELLAAAVSVKCKLDISPMSRTLVEGEPTQLRQVIMNLVTNASEALGDRPGRVSVSGGLMTADAAYLAAIPGSRDLSPGEYVYLEVSDSGDGISPELQRRIFEPFFSTKFTGRGLGLATVLGIVRGHGGAIRLESEPGRGTCFRVLLPPAARVAPPPDRQEKAPPTQLSGRQILVVDDEEAVLELAGEFLLRGGLDPITAGGGLEALEILRRDTDEAIDAVVLDLSMPELDGHETLLEIRRLRAALPVIITSGYGVASSSERFTSDDAVSFLRKPFDPEDLLEALRAALA